MQRREDSLLGNTMDENHSSTQSWHQHHLCQETPTTSSSAGPEVKRKPAPKLTPSQRERKRAIDREAQRSIRTKTKNYIAHLENMVKELSESDFNGLQRHDSRAEQLTLQLRHSQNETSRLREIVMELQQLRKRSSCDNVSDTARYMAPDSRSNSPMSMSETAERSLSFPARFDPVGTQSMPMSIPFSLLPIGPPIPSRSTTRTSSTDLTPLYTAEIPEPPAPNPEYRRCDGEMFYYVEFLLNRAIKAGPEAITTNQAQDEDICVRALVHGWNDTEDCHSLDIGWRALQQVDQIIFPHLGIVERIASLRMTRQRLIYQINSNSATTTTTPSSVPLPPFLIQEVVPPSKHSAIIDHFVWPGLRHLLYRDTAKYITTPMNEGFRLSFRFLWNYQVAAAYALDPVTQMYTCTPEFICRQLDLRCWTMKRAYLDLAPELLSAIPAYEPLLARPISSLPPQTDVATDTKNDAETKYG